MVADKNISQTKEVAVGENDVQGKKRKVRIVPRRDESMVEKLPVLPGDKKRVREESDDMELDELKCQKGEAAVVVEDAGKESEKVGPADRSCTSQ